MGTHKRAITKVTRKRKEVRGEVNRFKECLFSFLVFLL